MIQRNEAGDLDYKSISQLYELEADFNDAEYSSIMQLFKEATAVRGTAISSTSRRKTSITAGRRWNRRSTRCKQMAKLCINRFGRMTSRNGC